MSVGCRRAEGRETSRGSDGSSGATGIDDDMESCLHDESCLPSTVRPHSAPLSLGSSQPITVQCESST